MLSSRPSSVAFSLLASPHLSVIKPTQSSQLSIKGNQLSRAISNFGTFARFYCVTSSQPTNYMTSSTKLDKLAIVGLGNIGKQYEGTRHNIGFACVDDIAAKYKLSFVAAPRLQALIAEGKVECTVEVRNREPKDRRQQRDKKDKKDKKEPKKEDSTPDDADKPKEEPQPQPPPPPPPPRPPPTYIKVTKHLILIKPTTLMNLSGSAVSAVVKQYQVPLSNLLIIMDDLDLNAGRVQVKRGGGSTQRGVEDVVRALRTQDFLRVRFGISQPPGGSADKSRFVLSRFSRTEMEGVKDGMNRVCEAVKVWLEKGEAHAMNIINKR